MKPAIRYIFFLGMIFFHPCRVLSLESRQGSNLNVFFQEIQSESSAFSEGSQNSAFFFEDDLFNDDDDDGIVSLKKKIHFIRAACFGSNQYTLKFFCNTPHNNSYKDLSANIYCYVYSSQPCQSLSDFISLRVLRL
jgi:hypothetical protein